MKLDSFSACGLGNTPIYIPERYCPSNNLYLKLEKANPHGSIKDRTAYYIFKDLVESGRLKLGISLVESSSGNLGLALAYFASKLGVRFMCIVDPLIAPAKLKELEDAGVEVHVVSLEDSSDYRSARIKLAGDLDKQDDWIWTNQYDNPANFRAHYETTGPEIASQMNGQVDYVVCSVGTGGTICGIGHYLKRHNPAVKVVAVEPVGSTIFGGKSGKYLNVGAGMLHPSGIFRKYGHIVDFYCKVDDRDALQECADILEKENLSVGVTTGSVLVAASCIAARHSCEKVVAVAPDGGEKYTDLFKSFASSSRRTHDITLIEYT